MTRNSNQTIPSKLNIIRQLEYCRLARAAELLGCSVSDLIHFGETERATIYVLLNDETATSVHFPKYTNAYPHHLEQLENGKVIFNSHTYMRPFSLGVFEKSMNGDLQLEEPEEPEDLRAGICGLWQLPPYILSDISDGKLPDIEYLCVRLSAVTSDGDFAYADVRDWDFVPTVNDMYIKQADMLRIYESFNDDGNKKPLLRGNKSPIEQEAQARPSVTSNLAHAQAERHAAKREVILTAAIHAKHRWPDECGNTPKSWTKAIYDHEIELFRTTNDGVIPLSLERIELILVDAINKGIPHKSK